MNKYLRHLLWLGLLGCASSVIANDSNPNSAGYHARHNASSVYYQGPNGAANQPQQQSAPQPTGYWVKTWGAIAGNPATGVLGTITGADNESEATQQAIAKCKAAGGGSGCKLERAYHNQCVVMVVDDEASLTARAATIKEASDIGLAKCHSEGGRGCRVHYSACTEPRFVKY